ncbi:hypothetical protein BGX20_010630, partial [Mortierella sp. AD010]
MPTAQPEREGGVGGTTHSFLFGPPVGGLFSFADRSLNPQDRGLKVNELALDEAAIEFGLGIEGLGNAVARTELVAVDMKAKE